MATEKRMIAYDPITFESFTRNATKHREPDACQYDMGYVDAVDQIVDWFDANTVDAVEVVHGRWIETLVPDGYVQKASRMRKQCSVCGWTNACRYHYCPNCVAKMDGDGNG